MTTPALSRRTLLTGGLAAAAIAATSLPAPSARADVVPTTHVDLHTWRTPHAFAGGSSDGIVADAHGLRIRQATGTRTYLDPWLPGAPAQQYEQSSWTSDWVDLDFGATQVVASWNATTPGRSWIEVSLQARCEDGYLTDRYVMARWCEHDVADGGAIQRCTVDGQDDMSHAWVNTDTFTNQGGHTFVAWRLVATLLRPVGSADGPVVSLLAGVASDLPKLATGRTVPTSQPGPGRGRELAVPTLSQELHRGHYPEWDNGGEAWCSATSTAMVVQYWHQGPSAAELAWVDPPVDAQVDFTARNVYDYCYGGTGNWPFNPAYAASRGADKHGVGALEGFVHRCRTLREAEDFIATGIPLICSVSFSNKNGNHELDGAGYSTSGHLLVIVGFTDAGDVIVNDPASHLQPDDGQVRVVYRRDQFENVWIGHGRGTCYVIRPRGTR